MSDEIDWYFRHIAAGGSPARTDSNALRSSGLKAHELLMREAPQNSADEQVDGIDSPVEIHLDIRSLTGEEKKKFVETSNLAAIKRRIEHFGDEYEGWFSDGARDLEDLEDLSIPLPVVYFSDHNTNGLTGRWDKARSSTDRFHRLVLAHQTSRKQRERGRVRLGSYGVGKQAFTLCSRIRVVGYYSRFNPTDDSSGVSSRLMMTGMLPEHYIGEEDFSGHSYWGTGTGSSDYPARPLEDENAHAMAEALGCVRRGADDTGTTVILPYCSFDVDEIREAIEKWWWPRLVQNDGASRIVFRLFQDGREVEPPKPEAREHLIPYINCYRNLASASGGDSYRRHDIEIKRVTGAFGSNAGRLSLTELEPGKTSAVAYVRSGLVITYEDRFFADDGQPVAGVFEPSDQNIAAFIYAEPEAHHEWKAGHDRLKTHLPWGEEFVSRTLKRIAELSRDYQKSFQETRKRTNKDAAAFLDRRLANLFRRKPGVPQEPINTKSAFSIRRVNKTREQQGSKHIESITYLLQLSEHAEGRATSAVIDIRPVVFNNASGTSSQTLSATLEIVEGHGNLDEETGEAIVQMLPGAPIKIVATTLVDPSWFTQWEVGVKRLEE